MANMFFFTQLLKTKRSDSHIPLIGRLWSSRSLESKDWLMMECAGLVNSWVVCRQQGPFGIQINKVEGSDVA
jgi:hypothetical protein